MDLLVVNIIAAVGVLFFAGLIAHRGLTSPLNRRFVYFLLAILGWLILNYLSNQAVLLYDALLWVNRLLFVMAIFAVGTMLRFSLTIRTEEIAKKVDVAVRLTTAMGAALALTPYVVESITVTAPVVGVTFGWGAAVYFLLLAVLAIGVVVRLFYDTAKAKGITKARARVLFAAFGVGTLLIMITNVILPAVFNLFYLSTIGPLFSVVILAGVGYAIIKYRLFDIRSFVARSFAYILTVTVLALLYGGATFGIITKVTNQSVAIGHEIPYFIVALFLGLTFQPLKRFFDKISDKLFYKDHYDIQDVLNNFSKLILGEVHLHKLLDGALSLILQPLKSEFGKIILVGSGGEVIRHSSKGKIHTVNMDHLTAAMQINGNDILVLDREDGNNLKRGLVTTVMLEDMRANDIQIIVRLKTPSNNSIGYILIGAKRSNRIYADKDIQLLGLISGELAVAAENGLRFEEIRNFNETLKEKVDSATLSLRQANKQLQHVDEVKDEFVSMASHQLRTPLTSVKGYISMVLEGDAGRITAMQRQLLEEAFTSSERMVHLISDFLNVSRLQTGKFMIDQRAADLAKVVEQEVNSLETTAKAHDLRLQYHAPSYFPTLYVDEGKIRQVLMNFIDNAIYYSREDSAIDVTLSIIDGNAVVQVHDTGIGVPKAEQAHLFTKFFRASNARKQRPDGTGVGLFLAKKVILAHGGSMLFESVEGVGSTFGFRLPIKKLSDAPTDNADELDK